MNYWYAVYITVGFYLLTWILLKRGGLKQKYFRLIWNTILLFAFLAVAGTGVYKVFEYDFFITEVHKVSGLVLVIASVTHIIERFYFFQGFWREFKQKHLGPH